MNDSANTASNTAHGEPVAFRLDATGGVPAAARAALNQDGVVCIRQAFNRDWLDVIELGIEQALSGASTDVDIVKRKGDAGSFSFSSGAWQTVEPFRRFIFDSPMPDLAQSLFGSQRLGLFYDFLLLKQPRSDNAATPWHQDHSYYPLDGRQVMNCWVALDDIPLESALRFMRGSHQPGQLYRAIDFENPARDYRHARKELPLPPDAETPEDAEILTTALRAGDMLAWTSYTLHSAPGNKLDQRRAAFSVNWLGDDVVFNGKPSLESYRDSSQVVGEPIICEKFPLVRG